MMKQGFYQNAEWWRQILAGGVDEKSIYVGKPFDKKMLREMTRYRISDTLTLSVPLVHGPGKPMVSDHGRWRRAHLNALQAAYGRTPYYPYLMSEIAALYDMEPPYPPELLLRQGDEIVRRWLRLPEVAEYIRDMRIERPDLYEDLCREWQPRINHNLWIGDALFKYGPDAVFGLI